MTEHNTKSTALALGLNSWGAGYFCCPDDAVWFKFTPSTTKYYTIRSDGSLDVMAQLYNNSNVLLNQADDEGPGMNFRMVAQLTAGQTYYIKVTTFGAVGAFNIIVSNFVYVESVTINPEYITMSKNSTYNLTANVAPSYATNKNLYWQSGNTNVATVDSNGRVTAVGGGETRICAYSQDGSNKDDCCTVYVHIPVTGLTLSAPSEIAYMNQPFVLSAAVSPYNATNKRIIWCSSDPTIAEVDADGDLITHKPGNVTITAITADGGFVDSCYLSIKELVIIEKDGNYSKVIFDDGKVWKCNRYYYDATLESNQPVDNERSRHNHSIDFTEKQLGFLFRIDPNGVIYYVGNKSLDNSTSATDYLIYRDDIFKEIYGRTPKYFIYEDSKLYYCTGVNYDNRYSVYSEAELIFGILPRWTLQNVAEILFDAALAIISIYCPALSVAMLTADIIAGYFFTNLVENATNAAAEMYIQQSYKPGYANKLSKQLGWVIEIVNLIPSLLESALPPDIDDAQIAVYENAYQNESYIIKISDNNQTVDLNEFIEHYKSLIPTN